MRAGLIGGVWGFPVFCELWLIMAIKLSLVAHLSELSTFDTLIACRGILLIGVKILRVCETAFCGFVLVLVCVEIGLLKDRVCAHAG